MTASENHAMREPHGPIKEQSGMGGDTQSQRKPHFGNYDLVRRIDVGGMGEVYLARQRTAFGREVALKIIRSDLMHDVTVRKRFLREAEVSAHLKHDHILPLVEFGEEQGRLFLVTPYIAGGTLSPRLQRGPIPLAEVYQLFSALVRAVAYVHKRGVIHRDLKPSNILLDREGDQTYVRLIDFGIATIQGMAADAQLTSAGNELGTIAYMAPERLSGVAAPSNDIYSLGIILYQMLTGHLPQADTMNELPPALESIVQRCIALDPNQRFTTADDLLKAFEYAYRFLSASQKAATGIIKSVAIDEDEDDPNISTPRKAPMPRPLSADGVDSLILRRVEISPQSKATTAFKGSDYNAPTSFLASANAPAIPANIVQTGKQAALTSTPRPRKRRNMPLTVSLLLATGVILLAIVGFGLLAFQAALSANVTVTPQVHTISTVLTITAKLGQKTIDPDKAIIPASVLSSTQKTQQQGPTTGHIGLCIFGFDCQQAVSDNDVATLTNQALPSLRAQISQDLQQRARTIGATLIGAVHFVDPTSTATPPVGTPSQTVTVSVSEEGGVGYIKSNDVTTLARILLDRKKTQDLGPKYVLLSPLTQIGQPSIQAVDANGNLTIQIAVAGVAKYQLTASDLLNLRNSLKGMKLQAAQNFLMKQAGIDPKSVNVHLSYGDTMPSNLQQIKVIAVDPTNLPTVQLSPSKAGGTPIVTTPTP